MTKKQPPPEKLEPFEEPERFDRLAALLPALDAHDEHVDSKLFSLAHDDGVIYKNFDWPTYMKTLKGEHFTSAQVVDADLVKCRKLLTIIVRQERFCDGSLAGHVQEGFAGALVRRIVELTGEERADAIYFQINGERYPIPVSVPKKKTSKPQVPETQDEWWARYQRATGDEREAMRRSGVGENFIAEGLLDDE